VLAKDESLRDWRLRRSEWLDFERGRADHALQEAGIEEHIELGEQMIAFALDLGRADFFTRSKNDKKEIARQLDPRIDIEHGRGAGDALDQAMILRGDREVVADGNDEAWPIDTVEAEAALGVLELQPLVKILENVQGQRALRNS
jgi:hypothetical protein